MIDGTGDREAQGFGPVCAYQVLVTNMLTGDEHIVSVLAHGSADAQTEALRRMFSENHWRQCRAAIPQLRRADD